MNFAAVRYINSGLSGIICGDGIDKILSHGPSLV